MPSPFVLLRMRRKKKIRELSPKIDGFSKEYDDLVRKWGVGFSAVIGSDENGKSRGELIIEEKKL